MTAPEAKARLEAWVVLLKAKLEGVTPGPWDWEYGVTMRTAWGLMSGRKYILRFAGPNDIEECPDPEVDMVLIEIAPPLIKALLAGIEAVLNAKVKDQADLPVMEDRSVVVYPRAGKTLRTAITVAEASILIAMAEAYEPYFQEVQS